MRGIRLLGMLFCALAALGGCTRKDSNIIKIGLAGPLTGDSAQFGQMMKMGGQLMVDQVNEAGGIDGKQVQLVLGDDKADPKEAGNVAQKFASDPGIFAVVGHFNSSCSKIGKPIYRQNKLLQISPGSTNDEVCIGSDFTFRNIYRDDFQGKSLANYVKNVLGLTRVAVFYDNDDYGAGLKTNFANEGGRIGLQIVAEEAFNRDTQDFTPQLTRISSSNPEIIFISGLYTQGAQIAVQARKLGVNAPLCGADGMLSADLVHLGGPAVEGMLLSVPFLEDRSDAKVSAFLDAFQKRWDFQADAWAALTYDAVGIVVEGMRKGGLNTEKIRDAVAAMNTAEKGYPGITGLTYFDQNGDCLKPLTFALVQGGKFVKAPKQGT